MRTAAWLNKKYKTLHPATVEPFADEVRAELMPLCDQDAAEAVIYARGAALKEAMTEIEALKAQLAKFTPLRARGVVDADDNLDCWDTAPFELCRDHVAALNEKDPAAMWRVVDLYAVDLGPNEKGNRPA